MNEVIADGTAVQGRTRNERRLARLGYRPPARRSLVGGDRAMGRHAATRRSSSSARSAIVTSIVERTYGAPTAARPIGGDLRPTDERFVDPESGLLVTVWFDPSDRRAPLRGRRPQSRRTASGALRG